MLDTAIFWAGVGQLALVIGSLAIPKVLKWDEDTAKLRPLTRHVFWTYAGYIWATNLSMALVSMISPSVSGMMRMADHWYLKMSGPEVETYK